MRTGLFKDIKSYPSILLPIVDPGLVAKELKNEILAGSASRCLYFPKYNLFMPLFFILRVFPLSILWYLINLLGVDESMQNIRQDKYGNEKKAK